MFLSNTIRVSSQDVCLCQLELHWHYFNCHCSHCFAPRTVEIMCCDDCVCVFSVQSVVFFTMLSFIVAPNIVFLKNRNLLLAHQAHGFPIHLREHIRRGQFFLKNPTLGVYFSPFWQRHFTDEGTGANGKSGKCYRSKRRLQTVKFSATICC